MEGVIRKVDYHLKNLVIAHLSTPPELTPQEIAESSRAIAEAAALTAKAARATAVEKAAAASRAIAAAKTALHFIASFPNAPPHNHAASHLFSKKLQLGAGDVISNSSSSCQDKNEEERPDTEPAISNNGTAMEIDSPSPGRMIEEVQVPRKRGRPKSKL